MICLVHDVIAKSVSLLASEFSTGHHAFDDIPLRKAGFTSGVKQDTWIRQHARSSRRCAASRIIPPSPLSHLGASTMEIIFQLGLSDSVVYGLSLVKFASDIS